jgi:Putative Ig domain
MSHALPSRRATKILLAVVLAVLSAVGVTVLLPSAASAAAPIVVDDFGGHTAGPRTVTPLPLPMTSTTAPGQFSEAGGLGTMSMTGKGNSAAGVQLDYNLPHLDLTSAGNNTQFFLVFKSIQRTNASQNDSTAAIISISLTGGGVTGTYQTGVGNVSAFNIVLNFSCAINPVCFKPQPDFTAVTHVTVTVSYPRNHDPNGTTTAVLDSINTTPTGGAVPPPASASITSPANPSYGASGTTLDFPVAFTSNGQPATVFSASSAVPLTKNDVSVNGTATGVTSYTVTGSGANYTIHVGPLTGPGTVAVSIPAGAAVDTWAQPTLASNVVSVQFVIPVPPAFTGPLPPDATVGSPYSYQFTAGGTPAATYSLTAGPLPAGLTLSAGGLLSGTPAAGASGIFPITVSAANIAGTVTDPVDLTVFAPAAITSADHASFVVGTAGSFTVTTSGFAVPELTFGATPLPAGLTLTNGHNGTATISGTPSTGAGGTYSVAITASNQTSTVSQTLTITVNQAPAFTSSDSALFLIGTAGSFTVTTTGVPTPTISAAALPAGLTFTDNGDGTATIAGTPTATGVTTVVLSAANSVTTVTQTLTIAVDQGPAFTSEDNAVFVIGTAGSFTVTTTGVPAPTITAAALPAGLTFTDNGDGTATIAGTPQVGTAGDKALVLTATSGALPPAEQSFTLKIKQIPAFTSADSANFQVGVAGTFQITATGTPLPTLTLTGTLPAGLTFTDNGDGTATIVGTPAAGSAGSYPVTINAVNDLTDPTQTLTLTIAAAAPSSSGQVAGPTATASGAPSSSGQVAAPTATTTGTTGSGVAGVSATTSGEAASQADADTLASTGARVEPMLVAAIVLVILGTLLTVASFRRRRSH